ncbi:hypothetical protein AB0N61_03960 [Microbacterium sp. NPDC089320]|uniref:hypothetical protein n=1 Tax=Microbacterium sp. NPDC089320 TaxID=3155182 RepID=UPI003422097E
MPDPVLSVHDLVQAASLTAIAATRLHCHRDIDVEASEDFEISPEYALNIAARADEAGFRILFRTSITVPIGQIACDIAAEYELDGVVLGEGSSGAMQEFVNNVAIMHILPYARQSIADLTQRVFSAPLLMPIMQRGELQFQVGMDETAD